MSSIRGEPVAVVLPLVGSEGQPHLARSCSSRFGNGRLEALDQSTGVRERPQQVRGLLQGVVVVGRKPDRVTPPGR